MFLLSVQGRYAPAFQLTKEAETKLRRQIEAITQRQVLIISSKFRTDLLYEDDTNRLEQFIKVWCEAVGYPYTNSLKLNFFRSDEEVTSLTYFLYRLQLIKRIPRWYNGYMERLNQVLRENSRHPLCQKLSEGMEKFRENAEKKRLKAESEALLQSVHEFVNLKDLTSFNKRNCN